MILLTLDDLDRVGSDGEATQVIDLQQSRVSPNIILMLNSTLFFEFVGVVGVLGVLILPAALLWSFES